MIVSTNIPAVVRNWAICHSNVLCMSRTLHLLELGEPLSYISAMRLQAEGRKKYTAEETAAERRLLTRKIHWYDFLRKRIEESSTTSPSSFLMNQDEVLALVGNTLKWFDRNSHEGVFETITHVSPDGTGVCGSLFEDQKIDALDLLCRGYGHMKK